MAHPRAHVQGIRSVELQPAEQHPAEQPVVPSWPPADPCETWKPPEPGRDEARAEAKKIKDRERLQRKRAALSAEERQVANRARRDARAAECGEVRQR